MTWQPPTSDQKRQHALQMFANVNDRRLQKVASLRTTGGVLAALGVVLTFVGAPVLAAAVPPDARVAVLAVVAVGAALVAIGAYFRVLFRPLPTHLLTAGVATPAVVLSVGMVRPSITLEGGAMQGNLMRQMYTLEVQPQGAAPYVVAVRTFDGPMVLALNRPPVMVYVDPKNPQSVCPDWSTLPKGA